MNEQQAFERIVAESVGSLGPLAPSAGAVTATVARVERRRQRPRWLALLIEPPMRTGSGVGVGSPTLRMAALGASTVVITAAVVGAGVGGAQLLATEADAERAEPKAMVVDQTGFGDFTTISEAVEAAADGDTILVRPGRYVESVVVDGKDLVIRGDGERTDIIIEAATRELPMDFAPASGEGAPDMPAVIPAGEPYAWALLLSATASEVSDLTVVGQQVGAAIPIIGAGSSPTLERIVVSIPGPASGHWLSVNWTEGTGGSLRDSIVEGWLAVGPNTNVTIDRNQLPATCLVAWETGANIEITRNVLHGCPYEKGIDINAGNTVLIRGNDIWVEDVPPDASVDGYSGGRVAIELWGPDGSVTVEGNTLRDSVYGILVGEASPTLVISDNQIHDNGVGIRGVDGSSVVSGNTISANVTGVEIGFSVEPRLERNTITQNQVGLSISGNSTPVLVDNIICGNGVAVASPVGATVDLTGNDDCEDVPAD